MRGVRCTLLATLLLATAAGAGGDLRARTVPELERMAELLQKRSGDLANELDELHHVTPPARAADRIRLQQRIDGLTAKVARLEQERERIEAEIDHRRFEEAQLDETKEIRRRQIQAERAEARARVAELEARAAQEEANIESKVDALLAPEPETPGTTGFPAWALVATLAGVALSAAGGVGWWLRRR